MPEKSNVLKQVVKHKGYFNFKEFYNFCQEWLKDEGYDLAEDQYTEKITNDGKEIIIKWTAKKKISDYFRNIIEARWHILQMKDSQVEIEGKKKKINEGDIKITFSADLERDYEKRWEDRPGWKFMRGVYDRYIIRTRIDEYEKRLIEKAAEFIEQVKGFLQLEVKK